MKLRMLTRVCLAVAALFVMAQGAFATPPLEKHDPPSIIAILIGLFLPR